MKFLGQDTSDYPTKRPRSPDALRKVPAGTTCLLSELFASIPEIDDLFAEVVGGPPGWISVAYDPDCQCATTCQERSCAFDRQHLWFVSRLIRKGILRESGECRMAACRSSPLGGPRLCGHCFPRPRRPRWLRHHVAGATDPFVPLWKQPRAPVPDRGRPPRVQDHRCSDPICAFDHRALHAGHMATCRRGKPRSLSRSSAGVDGGMGTASFPNNSSRASREKPSAPCNPAVSSLEIDRWSTPRCIHEWLGPGPSTPAASDRSASPIPSGKPSNRPPKRAA